MAISWRELLLGYPYFQHKRLIAESKTWSRDEVVIYNESILSKYSESPVTQKEDYNKNPKLYRNPGLKILSREVTTGGSSGTPFRFQRDFIYASQKERAYLFDIWSDVGYKPYDLRVIYRGNTSNSSQLITYQKLENCYIIDPRLLNQNNKNEVVEFLKKLPPFFLFVYPSSLMTLINLVGEKQFSKFPITAILASSEAFPKAHFQYVHRDLSIPVAYHYGHSEYVVMAKYSISADRYFFYPTYGGIEFLPTDEKDIYKIIGTSNNKLGTIFKRYDTKDLCLIEDNSNHVQSNFLTVNAIIGREQEYFYDREGAPNPFIAYFFAIHNEFWNHFETIQFIQNKNGELEVLVVNPTNDNIYKTLTERFSSKVDLIFRVVPKIEKTALGKHRYFVQNIANPVL
ncbi:hypothetical protein [Gelidibacter japonicus]|uniref:hypothetical protein n=1 Tax=Gelidibacter japonicus TaxID=1962232 RepID=UPI003A90440C